MTWETLTAHEPELAFIERACRAARQQNAAWVDFENEHHAQIHILASRLPPSSRAEAISTIYSHLYTAWCEAMDGPSTLPWSRHPLATVEPAAEPYQ